ncbi:hypothetical protein H2248_005164 [Termitomyces sp. 'cryptogamus']|nr:hypothetical protein H2248_005164 [Termitomyces sp. 'cryptogamus']
MSRSSDAQDVEKADIEMTGNTIPHDGDTKAGVVHARRPSRIANPVPAGVFAFAATTWLLSMYNVNTRGIHTSNVVVGMALFGGGLTQFIAGMWEFPRGNVFGATVLTMYGAFWMSYATIFIPGSGVMLAFSDETEFNNAFGMYLIVWLILTLLFIPPVVRRNMAFTILLSTLAVTLIMLSGAEFTGSPRLTKAGGVFGIMTGLIAFYIAESELLASEARAIVRLPLGELAQ